MIGDWVCKHLWDCVFVIYSTLGIPDLDCQDVRNRFREGLALWNQLEEAWADYRSLSEGKQSPTQLEGITNHIRELSDRLEQVLPKSLVEADLVVRHEWTTAYISEKLQKYGKIGPHQFAGHPIKVEDAWFGEIKQVTIGGVDYSRNNLPANVWLDHFRTPESSGLALTQRTSPIRYCQRTETPYVLVEGWLTLNFLDTHANSWVRSIGLGMLVGSTP